MALALRMGMGEMWRPVETVFLMLVRELPDEYIVVDQTYSGTGTFTRDGADLEWGVLVLGPGMAALIHVATFAEFVSLEDKGRYLTLTYLDEDGCQQTDDSTRGGRVVHGLPAESESDAVSDVIPPVRLEEVVQCISRAEDLFPADIRRFFANLRVGQATVLPYARHEWDPVVGKRLGYEYLCTSDQLVARLREMSDASVFQDRHWNETRIRTFMDAVGEGLSPQAWEWCWKKIEEQMQVRSLAGKGAKEISDEALRDTVSQSFPFPLADSFRVVTTPQEPRTDYSEKLRCAENFLAYLGSLGVALARAADLSLKPEEDLNVKLAECWTGGISAGHWIKIIRETTRALGRLEDSERARVPEFPSFWWKPGRKPRPTRIAKTLEQLVQIRNDFHHSRGPRIEKDFEIAVRNLQRMLLESLRELHFLTQYPLWYVMDCEAQRGSTLFKVTYNLCMGDHPRFKRGEAQCDQFLVRHSIYLRSDERLLDLTPWIVRRACPKCGNEAMFFVEKIDKKKEVVTFKSFERGHTDHSREDWEDIACPLGL